MNDFLENPDERIAQFGDLTRKKLSNNNSLMEETSDTVIPSKKKNKTHLVADYEKNVGDTIHIRISRTIEQQVREILLNYYRSTGKKMVLREFADQALLEYIKKFEKR